MASSVFLQDPQGVVGPLTLAVELHSSSQAIVLHLQGLWEKQRWRNKNSQSSLPFMPRQSNNLCNDSVWWEREKAAQAEMSLRNAPRSSDLLQNSGCWLRNVWWMAQSRRWSTPWWWLTKADVGLVGRWQWGMGLERTRQQVVVERRVTDEQRWEMTGNQYYTWHEMRVYHISIHLQLHIAIKSCYFKIPVVFIS